jgi:hypothetical protein
LRHVASAVPAQLMPSLRACVGFRCVMLHLPEPVWEHPSQKIGPKM